MYQEQKEKKMFIKRRAKLIRNHWRNGIAGFEDSLCTGKSKEDQVLPTNDPTTLKNYFERSENRKESKSAKVIAYVLG